MNKEFNPHFSLENTSALNRLEEILAGVEHLKARYKNIEHQNLSLKKENDILKSEINSLKIKLRSGENTFSAEKNKKIDANRIKEEDFNLRNKIRKIVNKLEEEELGVGSWNEIIESIITEVDLTIKLLKK